MKLTSLNNRNKKTQPYEIHFEATEDEMDKLQSNDIYSYDINNLVGYGDSEEEAFENLKSKIKTLIEDLNRVEFNISLCQLELENDHEDKVKSYRKKPITIQALRWNGNNQRDMYDFLTDYKCIDEYMRPSGDNYYIDHQKIKGGLVIKTLEGDHYVNIGDYVIKGVEGEFYPCKPEIFEKNYMEEKSDSSKRLTTRDETGLATLVTTELNDPCEWCYDPIQKLAYYEDLEEENQKIILNQNDKTDSERLVDLIINILDNQATKEACILAFNDHTSECVWDSEFDEISQLYDLDNDAIGWIEIFFDKKYD